MHTPKKQVPIYRYYARIDEKEQEARSQCQNLTIFLPLVFQVKSILPDIEFLKILQILQILSLKIMSQQAWILIKLSPKKITKLNIYSMGFTYANQNSVFLKNPHIDSF